MKKTDEERLRQVLDYYEGQTEDEAVAEDEAAFADPSQTVMIIPIELVPIVRALIAQRDQLFKGVKARSAILQVFNLKDRGAFYQRSVSGLK